MNKRELAFIGILLSVIIAFFTVMEYCCVCGMYAPGERMMTHLAKILQNGIKLRFLYVLIIPVVGFIFPSLRKKEDIVPTLVTAFVSGIIFIVGYNGLAWYNMFVMPAVFMIYTVTAVKLAAFFTGKALQDEKSIFGISCEESEFFF